MTRKIYFLNQWSIIMKITNKVFLGILLGSMHVIYGSGIQNDNFFDAAPPPPPSYEDARNNNNDNAVRNAQAELDQLNIDIQRKRQEFASVSLNLENRRRDYNAMENALRQNQNLDHTLEEKRLLIETLNGEIAQKRSQNETINNVNATLNNEIERRRREVVDAQARLDNINHEVTRIRMDATHEAQRIVALAQTDAKNVVAQAHKEGSEIVEREVKKADFKIQSILGEALASISTLIRGQEGKVLSHHSANLYYALFSSPVYETVRDIRLWIKSNDAQSVALSHLQYHQSVEKYKKLKAEYNQLIEKIKYNQNELNKCIQKTKGTFTGWFYRMVWGKNGGGDKYVNVIKTSLKKPLINTHNQLIQSRDHMNVLLDQTSKLLYVKLRQSKEKIAQDIPAETRTYLNMWLNERFEAVNKIMMVARHKLGMEAPSGDRVQNVRLLDTFSDIIRAIEVADQNPFHSDDEIKQMGILINDVQNLKISFQNEIDNLTIHTNDIINQYK
jgi:predicted nuclease with TOPRIM domain